MYGPPDDNQEETAAHRFLKSVPKTVKPRHHGLVAVYEDAFRKKYGIAPVLEPGDHAVLLTLHQDLGPEQAGEVLRLFLQLSDEWFVKHRHSLRALKGNRNQVLAALGERTRQEALRKEAATLATAIIGPDIAPSLEELEETLKETTNGEFLLDIMRRALKK